MTKLIVEVVIGNVSENPNLNPVPSVARDPKHVANKLGNAQ